MNKKQEILRIVKDYNSGASVSYPIIDRLMTRKGLFGGELKKVVDSYIEINLLAWEGNLSVVITEKGIQYLDSFNLEDCDTD